MIKKNKILQNSKNEQKVYKCRNCYIIRLFLLAVIFIILFSFVQSDNLHYLKFVTPTNAATLIIIFGLVMFLIKLAKYIIEKKNS